MSRGEISFLAGGLVVLIALAIIAELLLTLSPGPALVGGALTEAQDKAIDVALDLCKTFIGWSIAVIGALAVLFKLNIEEKLRYGRADVVFASVIVVLGIISVFFGHLGMDLTQRALSANLYPTNESAVHWSLRLQYLAALGEIALFGAFAVRYFLHKARA